MLNLPHKNVGFFICTLVTDELNNLIQTSPVLNIENGIIWTVYILINL